MLPPEIIDDFNYVSPGSTIKNEWYQAWSSLLAEYFLVKDWGVHPQVKTGLPTNSLIRAEFNQ